MSRKTAPNPRSTHQTGPENMPVNKEARLQALHNTNRNLPKPCLRLKRPTAAGYLSFKKKDYTEKVKESLDELGV
jgi:hypothetical protein